MTDWIKEETTVRELMKKTLAEFEGKPNTPEIQAAMREALKQILLDYYRKTVKFDVDEPDENGVINYRMYKVPFSED